MAAKLGLYKNIKGESWQQKTKFMRMAGYTHLDYKRDLDIRN
jgi:hypothetical protein